MSYYTHSTELSQIQFELDTLADKLEDDWRTLFYLIPRRIADINLPPGSYAIKYNGTQEQELEDYGERQKISRARQLLEEWATSGRKEERPRLGHLLQLLVKGNMFRAADLIAKYLLNDAPPERPRRGPAAPIDIDQVLDGELEKMLDAASYPDSTALHNGLQSLTLDNNLDRPDPLKRDQVTDLVLGPGDGLSNTDNNDQSTSTSIDLPRLSALLNTEEAGPSGVQVLSIEGNTLSSTADSYSDSSNHSSSSSNQSQPSTILGTIAEDDELPNLSLFDAGSTLASVDAGTANIPQLSALFNNPNSSTQSQPTIPNSDQLPQLSALGFSPKHSNDPATANSNLIQFSSVNCPSSAVQQFSYTALESATANFDTRPFTNRNPAAPNGRILGVGGFGEVFLGTNLTPDIKLAAVKRLFPSNYKYREKFDQEREILSKYTHPNIVQLLGYCDTDQLCLVYEFLPGGTMEAALKQSHDVITATFRVNCLNGIVCALEYLHSPQVRVIHRDVTLANILLTDSTAKLCDFGLVRKVDSLTTTSVMGTGPYLAPESLRGIITPAMDVYSFGVVMQALVTGEDVLAIDGTEKEPLVDQRVLLVELPKWLECGKKLLLLVTWCLREKALRPTAQELRERIDEIRREMSE
ncbi:interleukin-1 receptor-associated kinase 4-like [Topomyia yanbarensis]|uniref:interleukin-1 receptor-associated kinase 4-like n=1 Tax=Topomyia yanbarensis TaxID=2498891 RepID=UPI00273BA964|nr:interleukin-1 receptor-associated kinase 4-like [Topomyia yanbarensis]